MSQKVRAMAYLMPQSAGQKDNPAMYLISISEIQDKSGLDFLSELSDDIEEPLEKMVLGAPW